MNLLTTGVQLDQVGLLTDGQLGWLPAQLPAGSGHGHPFTGAHPQQVDLELGERGQDVEEQLAGSR